MPGGLLELDPAIAGAHARAKTVEPVLRGEQLVRDCSRAMMSFLFFEWFLLEI